MNLLIEEARQEYDRLVSLSNKYRSVKNFENEDDAWELSWLYRRLAREIKTSVLEINLTKELKDDFWHTLYDMNGLGLKDFLEGMVVEDVEISSSQHGEYLYVHKHHPSSLRRFNCWSRWRELVSLYFSDYFDVMQQLVSQGEISIERKHDWIMPFIVFLAIHFELLTEEDFTEMPHRDKILFC
jgi:hypothetical protein